MTYLLPFPDPNAVLELGGGAAAMFRHNVDARPTERTWKVADLNEPLPFGDAEWPAIFSKFAVEHISWRNIPRFWQECHRILAPGGYMVLVVPNLLEQMRLNVELGDRGEWEWDGGVACRIFGDQDYGENAHSVGWSPQAISLELRGWSTVQARGEDGKWVGGKEFKRTWGGFSSVMVLPFGEIGTDMIVEARR